MCVCVCSPAVDAAGWVEPLGPDCWIHGYVFDESTNGPIGGALVRANQGSNWWTDTTDSWGYYRLDVWPAWGEFFMDASKAGYQTSEAYVYKEQDVELEKNWYLTPLSNNPPYTPSNPSPVSGSIGQPTSLTLTWSGGDPDSWDTLTYHVYFGTSSNPPYDTDVSTTSIQKSGLSYGTTYYWKIVSDDGEAQTAGPVWSFTTNTPPNTPSNPSPADWAGNQPTSLTLSWTGGDPDAGDTVTYDVYLYRSQDSPPGSPTYTVTSPSVGASGLDYDQDYNWHVVARDNHAASTTGPTWHFTTTPQPPPNNPPYTPSNPSPASGSTNQPTSLTLSWSGGDPDGDTVTYKVYFGTSSDPPYDTTVSSTSISRSGLSYGTSYYWKIVSVDEHNAETTGPIWSFTTSNNPPYTPSNPSPSNGATGQPTSPTLSWSGGDPDAGDTVIYHFYFGTSSNPPYDSDVYSTSKQKSGLSLLTTYYWKIVAEDNHGAQASGPVWSFTTGGNETNNPPNTPSNPSPTNGATGQPTSLTLTWTCSDPDPGDSIARYYVYFGTSPSPPYNTTTTASSLPRSGLAGATTYYWKIVAEDSHGAQAEGPVWSFMTNRPPYTPSNPSPANGATNQPTSPTLSWSGGDPDGGTVTYMVYFGTSPNPTSYTNTTSTSLAKTGLAYGTTYHWKVKAVDTHQATATGSEWSFTTQTGFYYFLDEPFNSLSAWTDNTGSTFDVSIDAGAARIYELGNGWENGGHYISKVVGITGWMGIMYLELDWRAKSNYAYSSVTNAYVNFYSGSQSLGSVTLVAGGTYDTGWQHKLTDVSSILSGRSSVEVRLNVHDAWSANWQQQAWFDNVKLYSTGYNNPPNIPSSPSPGNASNSQPINLTLSWSGGDVDGDSVTYMVYFGSSPNPTNYQNTTNPNLTKTGLAYETTHYWRVEAVDEHGREAAGSEWRFTTRGSNYPPETPSFPSPWNGETCQPTVSLTLRWSGGDYDGDLVTYMVYFGSSPNLTNYQNTTNPNLTKTGLAYGTIYYWRVKAVDEHMAVSEGAQWNFTTNYAPNAPSLTSPLDGSTGLSTELFLDWEGGDQDGHTVTYHVYLGTGEDPAHYEDTTWTSLVVALEYGTNYAWKVVAEDPLGAQTEGPLWRFRTEPEMYYGYYQVFDMNMSTYSPYGVDSNYTYHIDRAAGQSNIIVIPDRIYVTTNPLYQLSYAAYAAEKGLDIIFDIHSTLAWFWFHEPLMDEYQRVFESRKQCFWWKGNLSENNANVVAIYLFDEPVRGPYGSQMTSGMLDLMCNDVSKYVWEDKPTILMFHRQGNAPLNWTSTSFDQIASGYIQYCDWIGVDPYCYPRYQNNPVRPISMITDDADWALLYGAGRPLVLVGQSYDEPVPSNVSQYGWWPFFEAEGYEPKNYIMPNGTFISEYYNVATRTDKRAKALLWWWYPDSYASSFETQNQQMGVLPVHNVWADQQQLWLAANMGWRP